MTDEIELEVDMAELLNDAIVTMLDEQGVLIAEIKSIEQNCGSIWITTKEGTTLWISIGECETEETDGESVK